MRGIEAPPFWADQLQKPGLGRSLADHSLRSARHRQYRCRVAPTGTGAPEGDRSQGVNGYVLNT